MGNKVYIKFYNVDKAEYEWREFSTKDLDELMENEIIDEDLLGYAMKDQDAFEKVWDFFEEEKASFSFGTFADKYIELSNQEIRIEL